MNSFYNNFRINKESDKEIEEKRERSFGEQMYPVFIAGHLAKFVVHLFSFSAAVILPAYGFELMFGSFYIGLIVGFVVALVFIELPKWSTINTIFENYYDSNIISYGLCLFAVCLIAPSIASSTFGVPILVFRLSPDAKTINIEDIESKYSSKKESAFSYWEPQIKKHGTDASAYFKKYSKYYLSEDRIRLSSAKSVKNPYNAMLEAEKKAQSALNNRLDSIQSDMNRDVLAAKSSNARTVETHNFRKNNAGDIAFWLMLVLELCYVLIVWGLKYYEYRSKLERIETDTEQTDNSNIVSIHTNSHQTDTEQPTNKQVVAKRTPIKFGNEEHGKVFTPQGGTVARVEYKRDDGTFTHYTKKDLIRLRKKPTGSIEYKDELGRLIEKLENVKS